MIEYVCQRCKGFFSNVDCTSATISENQLSKSSDLRISLHISWWASREKVPFTAMTVMGPPQTWDLLSVKVPSAMLLTSSWWMWNLMIFFWDWALNIGKFTVLEPWPQPSNAVHVVNSLLRYGVDVQGICEWLHIVPKVVVESCIRSLPHIKNIVAFIGDNLWNRIRNGRHVMFMVVESTQQISQKSKVRHVSQF